MECIYKLNVSKFINEQSLSHTNHVFCEVIMSHTQFATLRTI